jgi:hypothetical protein
MMMKNMMMLMVIFSFGQLGWAVDALFRGA